MRAAKSKSDRGFVFLPVVAVVFGLAAACTPAPPPTPAPQPPEVRSFGAIGGPFSDPAVVPFVWEVHDANDDELTCRLDFESDGVWDLTMSPCQWGGSRNLSAGEGTFDATLEVSDPLHPPVTATTAYSVGAGPTESYHIDARLISAPDPKLVEAIDEAVIRWEGVLARGVPDEAVASANGCLGSTGVDEVVDDIIINVAATVLPAGYFGRAAPCVNGPDGLPRFSEVQISADVIDSWPADGRLAELVAHEFGHALGFGGQNWWAFLVGLGTNDLHWTGPRGVAEWSALGGEGAIPMEPLNPDHWEERRFISELMTCFVAGTPPLPLSAMTIAAMADSGYHVNLAAAEPYTLPVLGPQGHC